MKIVKKTKKKTTKNQKPKNKKRKKNYFTTRHLLQAFDTKRHFVDM